MVDSKRFEVINSTANVDKRLVKLFELIENDFLAKIMHSTQSIAPYKVSVVGLLVCCCCDDLGSKASVGISSGMLPASADAASVLHVQDCL